MRRIRSGIQKEVHQEGIWILLILASSCREQSWNETLFKFVLFL